MSGTVFITGANVGVGLATAKFFLQNGWNVAATSRAKSDNVALSELASANPDALLHLNVDLLDAATIQPAVDAAIARFGRVDALVNNAGYGQFGPVALLDLDHAQRQFDVNVFGTFDGKYFPLACLSQGH
jgi:NAD(P)-dependent dehydrogenase (short-subunit alcohol dehydrogenase family)